MGFWTSSSSPPSPPTPKKAEDGSPIAPDRGARAKCWEARDAYFRCLDRNNIIDGLGEKDKAEKACGLESRAFDGNCAASWVKYFKNRRIMEYRKEMTMKKLEAEGAEVLPGQFGPGGSPSRW